MKVVTYEATIEGGQVKLPETVRLPEHSRVYVVVPQAEEVPHIRSPRLAQPEQASAFVKEVIEEGQDARLRR